jgi:hypothetical protein
MTFRRFATGAALAIAGVIAAAGIGLLANSISGDSVGLGAEPLSAGDTLAVQGKNDDRGDRQRQRRNRNRNRNRNRGGDETRTTTSPTLTDEIAPATTTDDNGGDDKGGDDNSGKGSDDSSGSNSGSGGSGGSDSSGSGSGGSDDSGGDDD